MNILGSLQRWGTSLLNLVTEGPAEVEAKEADAEGSDGPGAGGGYETKDSVDIHSDGPGAGGGYDSKSLIVVDSDGPGAGGGYDGEEISRAIGSTSTTFTQESSDYFLTDGLGTQSYGGGQKSVTLSNKSWTVLPELQAEAMFAPKESQQKAEDKK